MSNHDELQRTAIVREWEAQERALEMENGGEEQSGEELANNAALSQYRMIARALREPILEQLPADFAARIARKVERSSMAERGDRLERLIQYALTVALSTAAVAAGLSFWNDVPVKIGASRASVVWLIAIAACVAASSAIEHGCRSFRNRHSA